MGETTGPATSKATIKREKKKKLRPNRERSYKPFLKYIGHNTIPTTTQTLIDKTAELNRSFHNRQGQQPPPPPPPPSSNNNNSGSSINMSTTTKGFNVQKSNAANKAKRNSDERHEDLQSKRHKDLTDGDKIFLLKREIDNLRSQVIDSNSFRATEQQKFKFSPISSNNGSSGNSSTFLDWNSMMGTKVVLITAMIGVGLLLVASKFLRRKISQIRTADSLLTNYRNHDEEEANQNGHVMVELQSSRSSLPSNTETHNECSSAEFTIQGDDDDDDDNHNNTNTLSSASAAAATYAPPDATITMKESSLDDRLI